MSDLATELDAIRAWPGIQERKPGVFYVKRTPFLHFHVGEGPARWADARAGVVWREHIAIPIEAGATARRRFLRAVRRCYRATAGLVGL